MTTTARRKLLGALAGFGLSVAIVTGASVAGAAPVSINPNLATDGLVVEVKGGHGHGHGHGHGWGRHHNRGHHYGWTRGRHLGWYHRHVHARWH